MRSLSKLRRPQGVSAGLLFCALSLASASAQEDQQLISGAPLKNPNVAVHTVEEKEFQGEGKRELALFPVAVQVNGKFTQHVGTVASLVFHLRENFGLALTGGYNWYNAEAQFNQELIDRTQTQAQAASSLLMTWHLLGGVEVSPLYGKFAIFDDTLVRFSFVVSGGLGLGGTRHQLKGQTVTAAGAVSAPTYGDTGLKFMGSIGAGFRLNLGSRFALRLEVRDIVYTARVERVNGCSANDLRAMNDFTNAAPVGRDPIAADVGSGCEKVAFSGQDNAKEPRSRGLPLALELVKTPTSDVLNNVGLYLGASFLF